MNEAKCRISIIGLDKMGVSMAVAFASQGHHVIGLDQNKEFV
jgi:UDP-N-acetyl-D-mannosaminuronate dehydrogenase